MSKIKWNLPGPDEPGFLLRRREIIALIDAAPTPENEQELHHYLVQFVDAPEGEPGMALQILLECSRRDYGTAILSLLGYDYTVPDPKGEKSGPQ